MERVVHKVLSVFLESSLFAGCCAVALCLATETLLTPAPWYEGRYINYLVFGGVLVAYNIHFAWQDVALPQARTERRLSGYTRWSLIVLGLVLMGMAWHQMPVQIYPWLVVISLLSLLYSLPLLPFSKRIKDYGILKIITLTATWTVATTILPIIYFAASIIDYPFEVIMRFLLMFALCAVFDIRDEQLDYEAGIRNLPHVLGTPKMYQWITVSLIVYLGCAVFQFLYLGDFYRFGIELLTAVLVFKVVQGSKTEKDLNYYLLYVDGMMLLYGLLIYLFKSHDTGDLINLSIRY